MSGKRIVLIDLMQGLAMILVILGHHLFPFLPAWYKSMHYYIYLFHMPFFIFISAFLIRYSFKDIDSLNGYWQYIRRKAVKFIPPYIIIGIVCILLKRPESINVFLTQVVCLLNNPLGSEATFLWYIYLLFLLYVISPIVFAFPTYARILLLAGCLLLSLNPINTDLFCLAYLCKLSPFFMAGILIAESWKKTQWQIPLPHLWGISFLTVFIGLSILHFSIGYNYPLEHIIPWIAIPSLSYVAWMLGKSITIRSAFVFISINCFGIYLLHMFFVQAIALAAARTPFVGTTSGAIIYLALSVPISIICASFCWKWIWSLRSK